MSLSPSLTVHRTELATWLPTLVLSSHGLGAHLCNLNTARPWEQTSESSRPPMMEEGVVVSRLQQGNSEAPSTLIVLVLQ